LWSWGSWQPKRLFYHGLKRADKGPGGVNGQWPISELTRHGPLFPSGTRSITRSDMGVGQVVEGLPATNVPFSELSGGAQRLVREFTVNPNVAVGVGSGIPVNSVAEASQYLGKEVAVLQDEEGNLVARVGNLGNVRAGPGEDFVLHTHPVMVSFDSHLEFDIQNASERVEAVVDWGGNVTYFNKTGVLQNPMTTPINDLGYIVGWR
jgi:hypothetical protein